MIKELPEGANYTATDLVEGLEKKGKTISRDVIVQALNRLVRTGQVKIKEKGIGRKPAIYVATVPPFKGEPLNGQNLLRIAIQGSFQKNGAARRDRGLLIQPVEGSIPSSSTFLVHG